MTSTADLRRTWAGHTAVEQLCDALDEARADWEVDALLARVKECERERDEMWAQYTFLLTAVRQWRDGNLALQSCGATQTPAYWAAIRQISDAESALYRALASAMPPREDER